MQIMVTIFTVEEVMEVDMATEVTVAAMEVTEDMVVDVMGVTVVSSK